MASNSSKHSTSVYQPTATGSPTSTAGDGSASGKSVDSAVAGGGPVAGGSGGGHGSHSSSAHHRHHRSSLTRAGSSSTSSAASGSIIRSSTGWFQRRVNLRPVHRGCHLVTDEVLKQIPEIGQFQVGICHLHIMHTSASLTLNENWDPDVREDMEMFLTSFVPENLPFRHTCEGPDDMPAHVKACFIGSSLSLPITEGRLGLGTWQGIWLCEHRNTAGSRKIMVTINGALKP
ncbi:PREDICTED: UPF0047 protein YjbQ-like [Rhagoletis zephyria]|uniref:UPF0047 protein YjbQ-like n=1 Tax=Rhagoletis zephyria TaxID=28612 RepID=UPI0008119B5C|nr:PREDICTED: UPF0047 protein YjbQ-like [Rhagoletis zephyria]